MSYKFSRLLPGSVGIVDSSQRTCGRLLHFDNDDNPFWWNGGYKRIDKGTWDYSYMFWQYLTHVVKELWYDDGGEAGGSPGQMGHWDNIVKDFDDFCIQESERKPRKFDAKLWEIASNAVDHFIHLRLEYDARQLDLRPYMLQIDF
jgi:hypothetical protein